VKRILIALLLVPFLSFSQTKDAIELCYAVQQNFNQFSSNSEANDALNRILFVTGATPNFVLMECDKISNAVAVTYKGERYILYDREFLSLISRNSSSWSNLFILAHEVGHHINGHTKDIALGSILSAQELEEQRREELEADYYAGFVLSKLGASLSQTTAAINLIGSQGDDRFSTHPDRNKRISSITRGWNNGVERTVRSSSNETNGSTASLKSWVKVQPAKNNPFDKSIGYAYTVGSIRPTSSKYSNFNPIIKITDKDKDRFNLKFIKMSGLNFLYSDNLVITVTSVKEYLPVYCSVWAETKKCMDWVDVSPVTPSSYLDFSSSDLLRTNGFDFKKMIEDKHFSNKQESINYLHERALKKLTSMPYLNAGGNNFIKLEGVFDSGDEVFTLTAGYTNKTEPWEAGRGFKYSDEEYTFYSKKRGSFQRNDNDEFIELLKKNNKLFLRIVDAQSALYSDEILEYESTTGRKFRVGYSLRLNTDINSIREFINENRYFEFSLSGSSQALSFD